MNARTAPTPEKPRKALGWIVAFFVVDALCFIFHEPLLLGTIDFGAGLWGYTLHTSHLHIDAHHTVMQGIDLKKNGARVRIAALDISYRPLAIRALGADLVIQHAANGTWHVPIDLPNAAAGPSNQPSSSSLPPNMQVELIDGRVTIATPSASRAGARSVSVDGVKVLARTDASGNAVMLARAAYKGAPFVVLARRNAAQNTVWGTLQASRIELADLLNGIINTPQFVIDGGAAQNVQLSFAQTALAHEASRLHLGGSAELHDGAVEIVGVAAPIAHLNGSLSVGDGGLLLDGVRGDVRGAPVVIDGGLGDLFKLKLQLTAHLQGDAEQLRRALSVSTNLPLSGPLDVALQVRGAVTNPTLLARVTGSNVRADGLAVHNARVDLAISDGKLTLLGATAQSGAIGADIGGTIGLNAKTVATLVGQVHGPDALFDAIMHFAGRGGDVLAQGTLHGLLVSLKGALAQDRTDGRAIVLAEQGSGVVGMGNVLLDHDTMIAGGSLRNVRLPHMVDQLGGNVALAQSRNQAFAAADVAARGIDPNFVHVFVPQIPAAAIPTTIELAAAGDLRALTVSRARIENAAYSFTGGGVAGREHSAVAGRLAAELAPFSPAVSGRVQGNVALFSAGTQVRVAGDGLEFTDTRIAGFPLDAAAGQIDIGPPLRIALAAVSGTSEVHAIGDPQRKLAFAVNHVAIARFAHNAAMGDASGVGWWSGQTGALSLILANGTVRGIPLGSLAVVARNGQTATLQGATLRLGTLLAFLQGDGSWNGPGSQPRYRIATRIHDAEIGGLLATLIPALRAYDPEATISAAVNAQGVGAKPHIDGTVELPTANVNGLPFHNGTARFSAAGNSARIDDGVLDAGTAQLAFSGAVTPGHMQAALAARQLDLAELADAVDPTAIIAGNGAFTVTAAEDDGRLRSSGNLDIENLAVGEAHSGDVALGRAGGQWDTQGDWIVGHLETQGKNTKARLAVAGAVRPIITADAKLSPLTEMNIQASVLNADIASRLSGVGIHAPVSGKIDAVAKVTGRLQAPRVSIAAQLHDSAIMGFAVQQARLEALLAAGTLQIRSLQVTTTGFAVSAAGTIAQLGIHAPLAIAVHATSAHLAQLLAHILGHDVAVDGAASATVHITGHVNEPKVDGALALENGKAGAIPISEAVARFGVTADAFSISDAEIEVPGGSITVAGSLPLTLNPFAIGPENAPLSLNLGVNDIDLANFTQLLPAQSIVAGTLNGGVALEGTPASPRLIGAVDLQKGKLAFKKQTTALDQVQATLHFSGTAVDLNGRANVGGGTVALQGRAQVPNLTDISSVDSSTRVGLQLQANKAHFDVPAFGNGTVDAALDLERIPTDPASLKGSVGLSDSTIPPSTFLSSKPGPTAAPPSGFIGQTDLQVALKVGPNVRLRSGAIDLGAVGAVELGGTVDAPTLDGAFSATGGAVTYLNRSFRVQQGKVRFDSSDGIIPTIDAAATTTVSDPDPNSSRNVSGQAQITLTLRGQPDHLTVGLSSDPSYSREQILGLLVDANLVHAVDFNQGNGQNTNGGLSTVQGTSAGNAPAVSLQNEALGLLDAQFSQSLLSPITSAIGGAVGLSDLGLSVGTTGNVGVTASRRLSGILSLFFEDSLGVPARQSLGVNISPNDATALSLSVYQEQDSAGLGRAGSATALYEPGHLTPQSNGAASGGATSNGVNVSIKRRFP